jgi:hypothetical protein
MSQDVHQTFIEFRTMVENEVWTEIQFGLH